MEPGGPGRATQSPTVAKTFEILRAFQPGDQHLGNKELVRRTGLPKATVSRLTADLVRLGYLRYSRELGTYALGIALLSLAYPFLSGLSLRHVARPAMKELADAVGGQVSLGMRHRGDIIYIESVRSPQHILSSPEIGAAIPILASAIGRAHLAALPAPMLESLLAELRESDPQGWSTYGHRVPEALEDYRQLGFTRSYGEIRTEIRSCGVALRLRLDQEIVAMNCGIPAYRLKRGQLEREIGPQLVATARAIEAAYGLR